MTLSAICIGGSRDGRRMNALYGRKIMVPTQESFPIGPGVSVITADAVITLETYRFHVFRRGNREEPFWVHESIDDKDALSRMELEFPVRPHWALAESEPEADEFGIIRMVPTGRQVVLRYVEESDHVTGITGSD